MKHYKDKLIFGSTYVVPCTHFDETLATEKTRALLKKTVAVGGKLGAGIFVTKETVCSVSVKLWNAARTLLFGSAFMEDCRVPSRRIL